MRAMDKLEGSGTAAFEAYVEALIGVIGHADRAEPLQDYCLGLMMPVARKSVEPSEAARALDAQASQ
jgi:SRSO17 transposase